ncbi:hypothetical protein BS50DRAFT_563061, partial [Corynespora cassiicola Philippines]
MGIHGIYKEIGPGRRMALSKLAVDKFEESGRPLRIAIDVSIWLFQIQASKGGTNPALRTFYYRLLRLISLSIHPVFVFDGPNKPPFKRNKRTGPNVASIPEFLAKQLLKQFGFPIHLAPGEAEAECALLQREGIVDAVLSEDVDTLMFGSGLTIRNWSPEQKTAKTPTHVNVYDATETKETAGLDRAGMILVALMSGGDYVPEGIPGCGPKTACEAARAGFGDRLCKIARNDTQALREWRDGLQHELKTNEHKFFKRRHTSLKIPDDFPRSDILGYYTHPAISTRAGLERLKSSINWDQELDFPGLRDFTHDAFDWVKLEGAKHFIRSLAPSLLVRQLRLRAEQADRLPSGDLQAIQEDEGLLVKGIHGKRQHMVTDNTTELRVSFTPLQLVKINLDNEEPDEELDADESPDLDLDDEPLDLEEDGEGAPKKRGPTKFDPEKPARVWVLETFVKVGVPLKVQDWEAGLRKPKRAPTSKPKEVAAPKPRATRRTKTSVNTPQPVINDFAKVTKPGARLAQALSKAQETSRERPTKEARNEVIDLLSSPVRTNSATVPGKTGEKPPPSVTKRRRRAPMQRSHTPPEDNSTGRSSTPPPVDTIEILDLVDPPALPSPCNLPIKKAKLKERSRPGSRPMRATSTNSSPGRSRQTTLDTWRVTPMLSPKTTWRAHSKTTVPLLEELESEDEVELLDLTLSLPDKLLTSRRNENSKTKARPPLASISSNSSQNSSTPEPSRACASKSATLSTTIESAEHSTRTSSRLQKTKYGTTAPEVETLDLTQFSESANPPVPMRTADTSTSDVETLDLTES